MLPPPPEEEEDERAQVVHEYLPLPVQEMQHAEDVLPAWVRNAERVEQPHEERRRVAVATGAQQEEAPPPPRADEGNGGETADQAQAPGPRPQQAIYHPRDDQNPVMGIFRQGDQPPIGAVNEPQGRFVAVALHQLLEACDREQLTRLVYQGQQRILHLDTVHFLATQRAAQQMEDERAELNNIAQEERVVRAVEDYLVDSSSEEEYILQRREEVDEEEEDIPQDLHLDATEEINLLQAAAVEELNNTFERIKRNLSVNEETLQLQDRPRGSPMYLEDDDSVEELGEIAGQNTSSEHQPIKLEPNLPPESCQPPQPLPNAGTYPLISPQQLNRALIKVEKRLEEDQEEKDLEEALEKVERLVNQGQLEVDEEPCAATNEDSMNCEPPTPEAELMPEVAENEEQFTFEYELNKHLIKKEDQEDN